LKTVEVKIRRKPGCEDIPLPAYMSDGAAGMDLTAAVDSPFSLEPGEIGLIPTGIHIELPHGYEAQIRPRSGLALSRGLGIVNSPGTVDADYRGEIGVIAVNLGREAIEVTRGMRVAQMVVQEVVRAELLVSADLGATDRGSGGFGHTGECD